MTLYGTAACSLVVVAVCVTSPPLVHASQNAEIELPTGATSPEPWRVLFAQPLSSPKLDTQQQRLMAPTSSPGPPTGPRLVCGMLVWEVDARLDPKMVLPETPLGVGTNFSNMPVIKVDCSDK